MTSTTAPAAQNKVQPSKTLYSVHSLRFFAAMAVGVHHSLYASTKPITSIAIGAAGVDIFFVISGLVIGFTDHHDGARRFFVKRVIRVIPLYWIATLAFILLDIYWSQPFPTTENIVRSLFLMPRYGTNWSPIYFPAWTLVFEMFFYVAYAAVLSVVGRHVNLVVAALMMFLAALHIPVPFVPGAFFRTDLCLEFATGVLLAEILLRGVAPSKGLGGLLVALSLLAFAANYAGTSNHVLGWGLPALFLVGGILGFESCSVWKSKILILGGNASYAIYLFQLAAMGLTRQTILNRHIAFDDWYWIPREIILLGSVILLGVAVHLFVERPLTRWLRHLVSGKIRSPFARDTA